MTVGDAIAEKLVDFHPRVKPRFASNWLDFLFVNSKPSGAICRAWTLKTTGARGRACMKRNMHRNKKCTYSYMEIPRRGKTRPGAVRRYREIARPIAGRVKNLSISCAVSICAN